MTEQCVVCGVEIPEGRQVCPNCEFSNERKVENGRKKNVHNENS